MRGTRNLLLALLFALLLPFPAPVQALPDVPCADRAQVVNALRQQFREQLTGYGLSEAGVLFEIYAATDGGWSLIITSPDGKSCLVASGNHWEAAKPPAAKI